MKFVMTEMLLTAAVIVTPQMASASAHGDDLN